MPLKKDFLWGGATAANQCEGAYREGGRGPGKCGCNPSRPERRSVMLGERHMDRIEDGYYYPALEGIDFYHHYKEDIALLGEMGFKDLSDEHRVVPDLPKRGRGRANEEGLQFYENVFRDCRRYGIEPLVTITHFDCPCI